jgi:hypothetical protein
MARKTKEEIIYGSIEEQVDKPKARDAKDYDTMLLAYIEKEFSVNDKK